ncbi:hypothetical protein L3Q82_017054 [Scortum barcoo]|uniref:Uncharacterized protein n=1 Tax=Scortum barcoo TaxID=214431 RepID=A0ACB8X9A6_9TELE|nr:hypothetical protein L3Q82_017054 [Scortum barcoo]
MTAVLHSRRRDRALFACRLETTVQYIQICRLTPHKHVKRNLFSLQARIKKIMQTDEEIGKVAAAVPVIIYISESPGTFFGIITYKGLSSHPIQECKDDDNVTSSTQLILKLRLCVHRKQCIELEQQFDFLKDLVATVPDMQGEGEENHTEGGGEKVPRRGRKPGSGRKNGGAGSKGKDKKLSGTESEQEDDSEDSETDGDEEDGSQSSTNLQAASRFHSNANCSPSCPQCPFEGLTPGFHLCLYPCSSNAPPQYMQMGNMVSMSSMAPPQPQGGMTFSPHPSMMSIAPPPPAPAPHKNEDDMTMKTMTLSSLSPPPPLTHTQHPCGLRGGALPEPLSTDLMYLVSSSQPQQGENQHEAVGVHDGRGDVYSVDWPFSVSSLTSACHLTLFLSGHKKFANPTLRAVRGLRRSSGPRSRRAKADRGTGSPSSRPHGVTALFAWTPEQAGRSTPSRTCRD